MSSKRRRRKCSRTAPPREPLPVDLLLEIVVCTDAITVVRCAATCRILRRAIVDPAFRRPLALLSATDGRGFDPSLLLGVWIWPAIPCVRIARGASLSISDL